MDPRPEDPRPALLEQLVLPAVTVGETGPGSGSPTALFASGRTDAGAMAQVLEHLYGLGHRRISSLRAEAQRLGLGPGQVRSVATDYSDAEGAQATRRILAEAEAEPPTAIVYDNDVMAVAGVGAASELGIPVQGGLSVVAWDDSALCRATRPRLTALVRDTAGFGRLAAEELLAVLAGGPPRSRESERPRLEPRESTAPPSAAY
ncbi:LacI family DNA-binding transcriptional regulator [Streptomyces sp. H27-H1]|uniref:LacI family DNA-binding transcriptional regulator n=1 Tax=Streptomyces sp. H27-H1 TaxID=2996461 RepID=UPI002D1E35F6|nr:LacI family DNA-binding transcriptional regulator [Streptomyces sp. H27-H1]